MTETASTNGQSTGQTGQMPADGNVPSGFPGGSGAGGRTGGNMISGSIIAADESSITVKTTDGSSKIILVSDSTSISKTEDAAQSDLITGEDVMVTGTSNDDGSVTATVSNWAQPYPRVRRHPAMRPTTRPRPRRPSSADPWTDPADVSPE